jgi:hypothetical protein
MTAHYGDSEHESFATHIEKIENFVFHKAAKNKKITFLVF